MDSLIVSEVLDAADKVNEDTKSLFFLLLFPFSFVYSYLPFLIYASLSNPSTPRRVLHGGAM